MAKLSIAMATYNGERYIRAQLESLAAQTRLPDELVITDDGSTDQTLRILEEFAGDAPFPVKIYRNEHRLGYTLNFFRAAHLCTGTWISFCDQDDIWLPNKLATIARETASSGVLLIVHSAKLIDRSSQPTGVRYPNFAGPRRYRRSTLPTWWVVEGFSMTFCSKLRFGFPDASERCDQTFPLELHGHDAVVCRLARNLGDVIALPDCLALHRRHDLSITTHYLPDDAQGIKASRKLTRRIHRILNTFGTAWYLQLSDEANAQALIYRHLAQVTSEEDWRDKMLMAEVHYRAFAEWITLRARLYEELRLLRRLVQFWRIARSGGFLRYYGRSQIGLRTYLKDTFLDCIVTLVGASRFHQNRCTQNTARRND